MIRTGNLMRIVGALGIALLAASAFAQNDSPQEVRVIDSKTPKGVYSSLVHELGGGQRVEIGKTNLQGRGTMIPSRCSALGIRAAPVDAGYYWSPMVYCGALQYPLELQVQPKSEETVPAVLGATPSPPSSAKGSSNQATPGAGGAAQGRALKRP